MSSTTYTRYIPSYQYQTMYKEKPLPLFSPARRLPHSQHPPRRRLHLRHITFLLACILCICYFTLLSSSSPSASSRSPSHTHSETQSDTSTTPQKQQPSKARHDAGKGVPPSKRLPASLLNNLTLTEEECRATFPGLMKEIDDTVALGPFDVKDTGEFGPLQGRIKDGKLYILHTQRRKDLSQEMVNSRTATLHSLHRALLTSPSPIKDTIFTLNFLDQPFGTCLTYSRPADPSLHSPDPNARLFLMPHFSFWAWPLPFIGSMSRAMEAITRLEEGPEFGGEGGWQRKVSKAVWRGTTWFSSVTSPGMRAKLVQTTKDKPWADVEALDWDGKGKSARNGLKIEDFCRYKYVIHTEGVTYSGRFQYLQQCASVVLTPPIQWVQHTTHLVRPLFSSDLNLTPRWEPSERVKKAWPVRYGPEEANIVFVAPDWSDLGAVVEWLEQHPDLAEGIARRQRELFVGGGYFSPAAEACYWRALMNGWAKVARVEGSGLEDMEGTPFELWAMTNGE